MIRRILAVTLIVLGLAAAAAGIASATIWRPADTATATLPARPDAPVVITAPGVLEALGSEVRIRAVADADEPVIVAFGVPEDLDAWAEPADHLRVTGLASWEELEVSEVAGEPGAEVDDAMEDEAPEDGEASAEDPAVLPDPATSDLWIHQEIGTGSVDFTWEQRQGRWGMLVATDGTAPAPDLEVTWDVEVSTPYLLPGLALGLLLVCLGVAWLIGLVARDRRRRRRAERRRALMEARTDETAVFTAIRDDDEPPPGVAGAAASPVRPAKTSLGDTPEPSADERPEGRRARRHRRALPAEGSTAAKDELAEYAGTPAAPEMASPAPPSDPEPEGSRGTPAGAPPWLHATGEEESAEARGEQAPASRRAARSTGADGSGWRTAWGLGPAAPGPAGATPRWRSTGAQRDDDSSTEGEENP